MYGEAITMIQLHYARATAELGSFSKAAAALGVTQPALSNGVASLERTIGGRLFERSTSGATLTALGIRVLPQLQSMLGSVDTILSEVRAAADHQTPLRVGVSPLIHPALIARALEAASRNELGPLVLREDNMAPLREALLGRELDVIVVPAVTKSGHFAHRELDSEPLYYKDGKSSADRDAVELAELSGKPLVMVGDTCGLTIFTTALFRDSGHHLQRYPGEADSYRSLEEWASFGLGGALLPRSKFRRDEGIRAVLREGAPIRIAYEALWDPHSGHGPVVQALLDAMLSGSGA